MQQSGRALHERLQFDIGKGEIRDGPRRYLALRNDVLMGLFDRLAPASRREALEALGRSVTESGADSVRAYLADVGAEQLSRTMEEASASLGWGLWNLQRFKDRLTLHVRNSPFAAGSVGGQAVCHPIAGMLQAVAQALWGEGATARELRCACEAGGDTTGGECLFEAVRASASGRVSSGRS
jgi:predicted hydrocarbon binding protein